MRTGRAGRWLTHFGILLLCISNTLLFSERASGEQTYKFERFWPTLQQPWYFFGTEDIAVDRGRNVYVVDSWKHVLHKFTEDGHFITRWGGEGSEEGRFYYPRGVALDGDGNVYVTDYANYRVQKFSADGKFIAAWGSYGSGKGQFICPEGIAADRSGSVYVVDSLNHRVQKFTATGKFLAKWGSYGSTNGKFSSPTDLALDRRGNIYVSDSGNHRIQKFNGAGKFLGKWGGEGEGNGKFTHPESIAVDRDGNVYVVDMQGRRVQKFTAGGNFITAWGSYGTGEGQFIRPSAISIDNRGNVYVGDGFEQRIQKFSLEGKFITTWGSGGSTDGHFSFPDGMARDTDGNILVIDTGNCRVQKFSPGGQLLGKWGSCGTGDGEFMGADGIAVDRNNNIYIADSGNHRIQKFGPDGEFLTKWGSRGAKNGEFSYPEGIGIDADGNVYVADGENHRIQKFSSNCDFIASWGSKGDGNGQMDFPGDIAIDSSGVLYVAEVVNARIQKFSLDGRFLGKWGGAGDGNGQFRDLSGIDIDADGNVYATDGSTNRVQKFTSSGDFLAVWGEPGSNAGQMSVPRDVLVAEDGRICIIEAGNNRLQVFQEVAVTSRNKAIVVAGGGPYAGNHLWTATEMCANFACRTLTYQGFTKENICYLSSDTSLDLDANGVPDDVDGDATCRNLKTAITRWAEGAEDVILYLTDHGGDGSFRMSGDETLPAEDLSVWLDTLEGAITGKIILIYDACESGSFLSRVSKEGRVVLTSTSSGEDAYFVNHGSISFSNYFWTHVFNGVDIFNAFSLAREAVTATSQNQHPLLDDNGNGKGNDPEDGSLAEGTFIGNGTDTFNEAPLMGSTSPDQTITGTSSAQIYAEGVTDKDGIARVWAMVRPPNFSAGTGGNPVSELPSFDLKPDENDPTRFEGTYNGFNLTGTYQIAVYAMDRIGNTSVPKLTTVSVASPLKRKAIIVAGGSQGDGLWPATERNARSAYEALRSQCYSDEEITFLGPVTIPGVDGLATVKNLKYAVTHWAKQSTQDLVVYLVGEGKGGVFQIGEQEKVYAGTLDTWLDALQATLPGKVLLIYDACRSGSFLPHLAPPEGRERILIASTGQDKSACFMSGGDISFSRFFWNEVANGADVREAFLHGKNSIRYAWGEQIPEIDDTGNGVGNEKKDGETARGFMIGAGVVMAGDSPLIGSICSEKNLGSKTSAAIRVSNVTSTGVIEKVWAIISPPGYSPQAESPVTDLPTLELLDAGNGRYSGVYNGFNQAGTYHIAVYAMDTEGNISLPKGTRFYK